MGRHKKIPEWLNTSDISFMKRLYIITESIGSIVFYFVEIGYIIFPFVLLVISILLLSTSLNYIPNITNHNIQTITMLYGLTGIGYVSYNFINRKYDD